MNKKKIRKSLFFVVVAVILIAAVCNVFSFFTTGKQRISVSTNNTYYTGGDINATVSVKKVENDKQIDAKVTMELYDEDKKKVKDVKTECYIDKGEYADLYLNIPKDLETGNYTLKITSKSGLLKDSVDIAINIIKDVKSNAIISLDKGIYKPGDEINFRALILSKRENTPVENEVSIYIYDGNENKVYSNKTKTSEYGIVSGSFKLADEVNSGIYTLSVVTESQEISKNFTVNPYITPKFEVNIVTDKETYLVGETAQITVSGKYFFGEPVKNAEVEGKIDGKDVVGFTDENGDFKTTYKVNDAKKIGMEFNMTDNSNYMIETSKTVTAGTDLFEIEFISEYGFIADGVDNELYVITKKADGTPIKTYSTVTVKNVTKQVISDENGIGKIILTEDEIDDLKGYSFPAFKIVSEDMEKNKIQKEISLDFNSNYRTLLKTDKVKYEASEDIEIGINSKTDTDVKNIYILKNNELVKNISTDEESITVNLGDVTGLIDIIVPEQNRYNYYSNSITSISRYNDYAKRTIFIKPSEKLNIDVKTNKDEYKPGENLEISFETTNENSEKVDAALLVSILDEAILNLAENDLSIDNIKLALEDIVLSDGVTAADLYAMVLDDSKESSLQAILLKQPVSNANIINKNYVDRNTDEKLALGILLFVIDFIIVFICILKKNIKLRKAMLRAIVPIINVMAIFVLLGVYLSDFIYDYIDVADIVIILIELVLAIIIYVLYLYKERDLIFKMVKEFAIYPGIIVILTNILIGIVYELTNLRYSQASSLIIVFAVLAYLILFTILHVLNRNEKLKKTPKRIYDFLRTLLKTALFLIVLAILIPIFEEYAYIIAIIGYVLYRKLILKETQTKITEGKIILNLNSAEIVGMAIGFGLIFAVMLILGFYLSANSYKTTISDSMSSMNSSSLGVTESIGTQPNGNLSFDDIKSDSFVASGSTNITFDSVGGEKESQSSVVKDVISNIGISTDREENEYAIEIPKEIEKEIEKQENVRNVFLESLAFIPELITKEGTAGVNLKVSDNITTWNIQTIGNTKTGEVGFGNGTFKVFKEFFVDFSLPANSVVTDKVNIPVTLHNYTDNQIDINLNVKENDWSKVGEYEKIMSIPAKSTSLVYVPLEIVKDGKNTLRVESSSGNLSDIVEKTMIVKPNGLEVNKMVSSGVIERNYSQDIIFNEEALEGTKNIKIRLYASPITQAIKNIEGMLEMPTGCFEQTSSSLYPDILVLRYLRENEIDNSELEEKALEYISKGYQKILTYEVPGTPGGYSLYGNSPAEPVLTAYGLMQINELSKVYEVDEKVTKEMINYLFDVQNSNGTYDYSSTYIGGTASTDKLAMNAYITWALSEVCPEDERLQKSIEYLEKEFEKASDSYTLALMANVFVNTNNKSLANEVIDELKTKIVSTDDGSYVESKIRDYYGTRGSYQNIQATALTSMALTKLNSNQKTNSEFIKYLQNMKDYRGTWGTTQSTILALKSIIDYSSNADLKNQTITVSLNGEEKKVEIGEDALGVYEFDFENLGVENKFSIEMKKGKLTYEVIKNYYQSYEKIEANEMISVSQEITNQAKVNDIVSQKIKVQNNGEYIENGLVEINIPQGCTVIEESLLNLKYNGIIEKYEYNYGKINIYLREFDKNEQIDFKVEYRALYPENITGAAIRVFDYYNPNVESVCSPRNIQITE